MHLLGLMPWVPTRDVIEDVIVDMYGQDCGECSGRMWSGRMHIIYYYVMCISTWWMQVHRVRDVVLWDYVVVEVVESAQDYSVSRRITIMIKCVICAEDVIWGIEILRSGI